MIQTEDTIAGIATSPGESGIGIIRISGSSAISICEHIFKPAKKQSISQIQSHFLTYGWIHNNHVLVDEVLLSIMKQPTTFTGEDVVEINAHGGYFVLETILNLVLEKGARIAKPGEFTMRAFLNGKIDLTKAEATLDVIYAKTSLGLNQAINQLKGKLYQNILKLKQSISWILSLINASIDFSEEDILFIHQKEISTTLNNIERNLTDLLKTGKTGRILKEGFRVLLIGEPNVGKSSLMNALLKEKRSIVTHIPGTTRDLIEEYTNLKGIPVSITDTAGIRETKDIVEEEGIKRAKEKILQSDLILWILDNSKPSFKTNFLEDTTIPVCLVLNKSDLFKLDLKKIPKFLKKFPCIQISAKSPSDIQKLEEKIIQFAIGESSLNTSLTEDVRITNIRQIQATQEALSYIQQAIQTFQLGHGEELLSLDLTQTIEALGNIVGETTPDDLLEQIFSNFCIGK